MKRNVEKLMHISIQDRFIWQPETILKKKKNYTKPRIIIFRTHRTEPTKDNDPSDMVNKRG